MAEEFIYSVFGIFKINLSDNVDYIASGRLGKIGFTKSFWANIKYEFFILFILFIVKNRLETNFLKIKESFGAKEAINT